MTTKGNKDFQLGNLCDDLVDMSLKMCGKASDSNPRFPRWSYSTYVDRIMNGALDIQEIVIICNECFDKSRRNKYQDTIIGKCVYLTHLIRIAWIKGYISEKQHKSWVELIMKIKYKTKGWRKSDMGIV